MLTKSVVLADETAVGSRSDDKAYSGVRSDDRRVPRSDVSSFTFKLTPENLSSFVASVNTPRAFDVERRDAGGPHFDPTRLPPSPCYCTH